MARFFIEMTRNDGKAEVPGIHIDTNDLPELLEALAAELNESDSVNVGPRDILLPVNGRLTVTRQK